MDVRFMRMASRWLVLAAEMDRRSDDCPVTAKTAEFEPLLFHLGTVWNEILTWGLPTCRSASQLFGHPNEPGARRFPSPKDRAGLFVSNPLEQVMPPEKPPFSVPEYKRMAEDLQIMSNNIRERPAMNHDFAERLQKLSKEMVEDCLRAHSEPE